MEALHAEYGDDIPKEERAREIFMVYWPTAAMGVLSASCAIGAQSMNSRRQGALEALYISAGNTIAEYQKKVIETIGEKRAENFTSEMDNDILKKNPPPVDDSMIARTGNGNELCYDRFSGRYFYSDMESIRRAFNDANRDLLRYNSVSVNEFYDCMNLDHTDAGYMLGWNVDCHEIQPAFSSQLAPNGKSCIVFGFATPPKTNYYQGW
jgi:hypothetical protein